MPLSQNDSELDYDGSWGDASAKWPYLAFKTEDEANHAYYVGWKYGKVPYGSYVLVGKRLRLEETKYLGDVMNAVKKHPYTSNWKSKIRE